MQIDTVFKWSWMSINILSITESRMDNTTKKSQSGRGSKEEGLNFTIPGRDQDGGEPAILTVSHDAADGDIEEKRSTHAGLSEEFFLSDTSGD